MKSTSISSDVWVQEPNSILHVWNYNDLNWIEKQNTILLEASFLNTIGHESVGF